MEVIIAHTHADFDAFASMVAAQRLYPQARMVFTGAVDLAVREFLNAYPDAFPVDSGKGVRDLPITRLIVVDACVPARLGEFRDFMSDPQIEVIIYDHHPATLESVKADQHYMAHYGATTTLMIETLRQRGLRVSPLEATLYLLGIYEETGNLTYAETHAEDLEAAAWCLRQGASLAMVGNFLRRPLTDEQRRLLNDLISNAHTIVVQGYRVVLSRAELDRYVDELAVLTSRLLEIEGADAIFTVVRMKNRVYVVGRSQEGTLNVAHALGFLGGGGHPTAASAALRDADPAGIEAELTAWLQAEVPAGKTARDIMSSPVVVMTEAEKTVEAAHQKAMRFGFSAYPVVHAGHLVGLVSRRDLDRLIQHGMAASRLAWTPAKTIAADTPVPTIQRLMLEQDVGQMPVVDQGQVVGIVSRHDLLRLVHGFGVERPSPETEVLERVRSSSLLAQQMLEAAGDVGDDLGLPTYVVGGFVRDLLLGVENLDIDLVVEGDGILMARRLAERLHGRVHVHHKFGTAVVTVGELKLDVATARIEFYTRPAALPEVMASPLKQDLYRRDFSINAMAIRLNRLQYGTLYDFFGGRRDLREGRVRVLHNVSFIDDPTRIFRAIRFEQRYHFRMDTHTETLLREAVAMDIFEHVSRERLRDEMILILSEARPLPAIQRMHQLRVLRLLHPRIVVDPKLVGILEDITATLVQYAPLLPGLERWMVYFAGVVSQLTAEEVAEIATRFRMKRPERALDRHTTSRILRSLYPRELSPSRVYRTLHGLSVETLVYLLARTRLQPVKQRIVSYLLQWRHVQPLLTGRDLLALGFPQGPGIRHLLDAVLDAQLDGQVHTVEEAKACVAEQGRVNTERPSERGS